MSIWSVVLSENEYAQGNINVFFRHFGHHQFSKLRLLTLTKVTHDNVDRLLSASLQHIAMGKCAFLEYQTILSDVPRLKTSAMRHCVVRNPYRASLVPSPQLHSLPISDCQLSMHDIQFLLSQTPLTVCVCLFQKRLILQTEDSKYWGFQSFFW